MNGPQFIVEDEGLGSKGGGFIGGVALVIVRRGGRRGVSFHLTKMEESHRLIVNIS